MVRTVIFWFIAALLPQLALAAPPPARAGAWQAIFDFCTRVDPKERRDFDEQADALFNGLTRQQIETIRETEDYKGGYEVLTAVLSTISADDGVKACHSISGDHRPRREEWDEHEHK
jgi:hypothetical protein